MGLGDGEGEGASLLLDHLNCFTIMMCSYITCEIKNKLRASLVVQWLRVCLPMQGTRVRALVWEDPTCHGATGPVSHNY